MAKNPVRWMMTGAGQPFVPSEFDPSLIGDDDVIVEIAGCGLCHTDLGYYYDGLRTNHALPLTLGHEISGRVVEAGANAIYWVDRAVIVPAVLPCGTCDACRRGKPMLCTEQIMPGNDIHGGFATHVVVPARGLCAVDEERLAVAGLELPDLAVIADAVTTPYQAMIEAGVRKGDLVIVNGVGGVRDYAVQIASAVGATVVAIDTDQNRLDAIAGSGAALTLNASRYSPKELKGRIRGFAAACGLRPTEWTILECSGTREGQETSFSLINHGATLCIVGYAAEDAGVRLSNLMAFHARVIGVWGCAPELYPQALELVLCGRVKLGAFVERHPLSEINQIFAAAHDGMLTRRPVLVPDV